jgi:hypothetical protein
LELAVEMNEEAAARFPRTASRNDPQECGALRQGNIAIIHSAPTGENQAQLVAAGLGASHPYLVLLLLWC